jgi:hypothetical protein
LARILDDAIARIVEAQTHALDSAWRSVALPDVSAAYNLAFSSIHDAMERFRARSAELAPEKRWVIEFLAIRGWHQTWTCRGGTLSLRRWSTPRMPIQSTTTSPPWWKLSRGRCKDALM